MREPILLRDALPGVDVLAGLQSAFAHAPWPGEEGLREASRAARHAARQLMDLRGLPLLAIPRGAQGAPQFPADLCGSLSHAGSACAAALGSGVRALGLDLEVDLALPEDVRDYALTAAERAEPDQGLLRFCAKECVHKALNPLNGAWLEFDEVEIQLRGADFKVLPLSPAARAAVQGLQLLGRLWRLEGFCMALLMVK